MVSFEQKKVILRCKCIRYSHQTSTTVLTIYPAIIQTKFQLSNTIIRNVSLFDDVIYFPTHQHPQQ